MNVLILVKSILPFLQGAFLKTQVLRYFAEISFAISAFLSAYHLFGMFSDKEENEQSEKSKNLFIIFSRVILTFIIIFVIASIYTLLWGYIGAIPLLPGTDIDAMWIYYSIFSFSISIIISVYYLSLTVIQKK
jgi:hypothetical protein